MLCIVTLSVALAAFAWAQDSISPHSAMEPPAAGAAASLAASAKASPPELLTTGEKSDWNETAPYAEAVEISHRLEHASRFVKWPLLEPQAPDSLARWGLMNSVFETGFGGGVGEYLSEPIARRMMTDNPELRKQFEAKLAGDPQFTADTRARLQWWFQQSKYEAGDAGRYPIARVWDKNW